MQVLNKYYIFAKIFIALNLLHRMIMELQHLILTRFNIQYEIKSDDGIKPQWLENRCKLFETYCLPSLQKQTCQNYIWIIFADKRTPEPYVKRLENYQHTLSQLRIQWTSFYEDYNVLYQEIGQKYANGYNKLLTSRIDNDDAFATTYVEKVQQIALGGHEGTISFPIGRQTFLDNHKSYQIKYVENHFLSRIETKEFHTILGFDHREAKKHNLLIIKTEQPMWEEIVHDNNIANQYVPSFMHKITSFSDFTDIAHRYLLVQKKRTHKVFNMVFKKNKT